MFSTHARPYSFLAARMSALFVIACSSPAQPSQVGREVPSAEPSDSSEELRGLEAAFIRARQREGADNPGFHVEADGDSLIAASPAQGLYGRFSEQGLQVRSDAGAEGQLQTLALRCDSAEVHAGNTRFSVGNAANRVERPLGKSALAGSEWFESGPLGLEHGYDVSAPGCAELTVELGVQGLRPELHGDAVRLTGQSASLLYAHLFAEDERGRELPAHFAVEEDRVQLIIDTHNARWPVHIDPLLYVETQVVAPSVALGSDGANGDLLGQAVAIDGDLVVVGASMDTVDRVSNSGSAYVFERSGETWTLQAKLAASDGAAADEFGTSVAVAGDTVVVGAPNARAAYVFTRSGMTWSEQDKLTSSENYGFGQSVAIEDDTLVVGAPQSGIGAAFVFERTGVSWAEQAMLVPSDGVVNDDFGVSVSLSSGTLVAGSPGHQNRGSAYVFTRTGTEWTEEAKLTAGDGDSGDSLGRVVTISGDIALIGAPYTDAAAGPNTGSAYVFERSGGSWVERQKLVGSDAALGDQLGSAVAIAGDTVLIGAPLAERDGGANNGLVYIFDRDGGAWTERAIVDPEDSAISDAFGTSVAASGDTAIFGAPDREAAYLFTRAGGTWTEAQKLDAGEGPTGDLYGESVAVSGDIAVVGVPLSDDIDADAGSAYVFVRRDGAWSQQARLVASDGTAHGNFGTSVAVFDGTILVGAPARDVVGLPDRDAAYVFVQSGSTWTQQARLVRADGLGGGRSHGEKFGASVDLVGDTAIIGSPDTRVAFADRAGAAYVFTRSGAEWTLQTELVADDPEEDDRFGSSVALSGDTAVVGAPFEDEFSTGAGAVYAFTRSENAWNQQAKLFPDGGTVIRFGASVAVSEDTLIVGAPLAGGGLSGLAYAFVRSGTDWTQQAVLAGGGVGGRDIFGTSVAIHGETALVGSPSTNTTTRDVGAAYVFLRSGDTWVEQARLLGADGTPLDAFGTSVAIDDRTTLVGTPNYIGTGLFGNTTGAAYFGELRGDASNGEMCSEALDCASGFCADGVCCNAACAGGATDCMACAVAAGASEDGVCGPTDANTCDDGLACTLNDRCSVGECVSEASPCGTDQCIEDDGDFTCQPTTPGDAGMIGGDVGMMGNDAGMMGNDSGVTNDAGAMTYDAGARSESTAGCGCSAGASKSPSKGLVMLFIMGCLVWRPRKCRR